MKPHRSHFVSLLALTVSVMSSPHLGWAQAPPRPAGQPPALGAAAAKPLVPPPAAGAAAPGAAAPGAAPPGTMALGDVAQHPELTKMPKGFVDFTIEEGDLAELITTISTITGKRFIYGGKVRNIKVNIYAPKNQRITPAEAYQTFLSVLETNGLTVIPHGKFLKIVESAGVATQTTPLYNTGQPVPPEDRYVTRLYRLSHVSAEEVTTLLTKFKSKDADISVYGPGNLLILTDTAANIRRMLELVEEIDVGGAGDQLWVEPIHYTTATDMAQRVNDIFDVKAAAAPAPGKPPGVGAAGGDMRITKIIPEDRTNTLVIVGTERAYLRVLELVRRLDVPNTGEGEVHVLPLQHAMAEELAATLNAILAGAPGAAKTPGSAPTAPGQAGIFEGAVKLTADKASNSLVITSSLRDYGALRNVIDKLDMPRRQVFIEAVIMDLSVDHQTKLGINYHGGAREPVIGNEPSLIYGGLNPFSTVMLPNPTELQGLALGIRGPDIPGTTNLLGTGISIPAFGITLNALATSGDANVLATPHIIATDNVAAEINVGENIPLQTNAGGLPGGIPGMPGATGAAAAMPMMGFGFGGFAAPRQDVGTKIKVVPHINDSDEVRLELTEEISERGAASGTLGAVSITKRNASTTVVVQDQQTVVIGGLMRDAVTTTEKKIPILGDIPVLGFLFRSSERGKRKTNLLLILTPYVVRDQTDLRAVFERKMQERQEFLDRYFVFSDQKRYEPPLDYSRTSGLLEAIRQAYLGVAERKRLEEETRPRELRVHDAQQAIEMPLGPSPGIGGRHAPGPAAPPAAPPPGAVPPGAPGGIAPGAPGGAPGPAGAAPAAPTPAPPPPAGTPPATVPVPIPMPIVPGAPAPGAPPPATPAPPPGAAPPPPGAAPAPLPPGAAPPPPPPGAFPPPTKQGTELGSRPIELGRLGAPPPAALVPPLGSLAPIRSDSLAPERARLRASE
jgi:general secretion pathway protein D